MVTHSHSLPIISAVCVVLLVAQSTAAYYDRSRRYARASFSRKACEPGGGASSSAFFSLGGWSGGGSSYSGDLRPSRNVRVSSYNNHDDSDAEGNALPLGDDEVDSSSTAHPGTSKAPLPTQLVEEKPVAARPIARPYARRIGIWVKVRSPSKERTPVPSFKEKEPPVVESPITMLDQDTIRIAASQPVIPEDAWNQMTGDEFEDSNVVDALAKAGLQMATTHDDNGWVDWKESLPASLDASLDDGEVLVYKGSSARPGFGSDVPWIKSISILPMSPSEGANLMMDSTRVKTYNSLSLGRDDLKNLKTNQNSNLRQESKIVRNVVQLPVANNKVESVTLLHTRELPDGSHLLVSRAIGGTKYASSDNKVGKSYILLGVNLFSPVSGSASECRMTAVTHAYSPGVPLMLAGKVGVKSAKNFIKDIRAMCEAVTQ